MVVVAFPFNGPANPLADNMPVDGLNVKEDDVTLKLVTLPEFTAVNVG